MTDHGRYYTPTAVPCECGSTEAYWHGPESGQRQYCCDPCWKKKDAKMTITTDEYLEHSQDNDGYCTSCGEFSCGGVEPDAEGYECPNCGEMTLMGTEQAFLTGDITVEEPE